jgi:hypothetical protein
MALKKMIEDKQKELDEAKKNKTSNPENIVLLPHKNKMA